MKPDRSRKQAKWSRLDNAAKIFPPTSNKRDTKVFRFACELTEEVDGILLQQAVEQTLPAFPVYQSILKKGLFWYYLEASPLIPLVHVENRPPCAPLYDKNSKNLLFDISYYHKRINLEVYHALADGTGALSFLRVLVYHYLLLRHPGELGKQPPLMDYDASLTQKADDSFQKYYTAEKGKSANVKTAYQLRGSRLSENRMQIIEGVVPVKAIIQKARELGVTMTVFLSTVFICSIAKSMAVRDLRKPVALTVPVNLRNFFDSASARNFFSVIEAGYTFHGRSDEFGDVLAAIKAAFAEELTTENLRRRLNSLAALEHNYFIRAVPLAIKDVVLRTADHFAEKNHTAALSNIGRVTMPAELCPYIRLFDVFVSTYGLQLCLCSFGDNLTLSFTSAFVSTEIQKNFFRALTDLGIPVEITASPLEEPEEEVLD